MTNVWYSPAQIVFTRAQIVWLLQNFDTIIEGYWPVNPRPSNLLVKPQQRGPDHAPYELACMIAGELDARLDACKLDGEITRAYYWRCIPEIKIIADVVKYHNVYFDDYQVRAAIRRALNFCEGDQRKLYDYNIWCEKGMPLLTT